MTPSVDVGEGKDGDPGGGWRRVEQGSAHGGRVTVDILSNG